MKINSDPDVSDFSALFIQTNELIFSFLSSVDAQLMWLALLLLLLSSHAETKFNKTISGLLKFLSPHIIAWTLQ